MILKFEDICLVEYDTSYSGRSFAEVSEDLLPASLGCMRLEVYVLHA